jgi:hypothetical protein
LVALIYPFGVVGVGLSISLTAVPLGSSSCLWCVRSSVCRGTRPSQPSPRPSERAGGAAVVIPLKHLVLHSDRQGWGRLASVMLDGLVFLLVYALSLRIIAPATFREVSPLGSGVLRRLRPQEGFRCCSYSRWRTLRAAAARRARPTGWKKNVSRGPTCQQPECLQLHPNPIWCCEVVTMQHHVRHAFPLRWAIGRSRARLEWASAEEITRYQERRLRVLVRVAASRSAFYASGSPVRGVDPASIRSLADLPRLPLLDRSHLVHESDQFLVYPRKLMWVAHSSGTSGRVVTVHRTPGSSAFEFSALQRQWSWLTCRIGRGVSCCGATNPDPQGTGVLTRKVPGGAAAGGLQLPAEPGAAASAVEAGPSVRPAGGRGMAIEHHDPGFAAARSWGAVTGDCGDHLLGGDDRRAAQVDAGGLLRSSRRPLWSDRAGRDGCQLQGWEATTSFLTTGLSS